jgi:hypothetical protein
LKSSNPKRPLNKKRRLGGGNRRFLIIILEKIVSNIFVKWQPIIIKRFFQQLPPADFGFKSEFFTFAREAGRPKTNFFCPPNSGKDVPI